MELYLGNDNVIELTGLKNGLTDAFENAGAVAVTLKDLDGTEISGEAWPKTLLYVAGSNGDYRAMLEDTLVLAHGQLVTVLVTADASGLKAEWEETVSVTKRN